MGYSLKKNIDNTKDRPAIYTETNGNRIKCLIDTGADTPIWTSGKELLVKSFPDAELQAGMHFELGGLGKGKEIAPVYRLNKFTITDDYNEENYITFKDLLVACCTRESISYPLILSATMFKHMNYAIINIGEEAPLFKIKYRKREYQIRPIYGNTKNNALNKIYSFSQQND